MRGLLGAGGAKSRRGKDEISAKMRVMPTVTISVKHVCVDAVQSERQDKCEGLGHGDDRVDIKDMQSPMDASESMGGICVCIKVGAHFVGPRCLRAKGR